MAVVIVLFIGIVLSLIPLFIIKGKEQIKVKKVKDTFYTMTGSKFFSDTLLGKQFTKAMNNKGYRYPKSLSNNEVKELTDELYKIAFDYAVKHKMVWGRDDYTQAIIQFCDSNDNVIQRAYDMVIAEKKIIESAKNSVGNNEMSQQGSNIPSNNGFETDFSDYRYNQRKEIFKNPQKEKSKDEKINEILDKNIEVFARLGTEMTISAFVAFHGDYEIKLSDDSTHYLQAKDGTCAYIVQELEDLFEHAKKKGEAFKLDEVKLKIRKYYSKEDNEIKYRAYYNYKGKE